MNLSEEDSTHLDAAEGWLVLGSYREASEELEGIDSELRGHPDVLNVRWQICDALGKSDEAITIVQAMLEQVPACRPQTSYALACLGAREGNIDEATTFLMEALNDASPAAKLRALNDKRLNAIWKNSPSYYGLVAESTKNVPSTLPQTPPREN